MIVEILVAPNRVKTVGIDRKDRTLAARHPHLWAVQAAETRLSIVAREPVQPPRPLRPRLTHLPGGAVIAWVALFAFESGRAVGAATADFTCEHTRAHLTQHLKNMQSKKPKNVRKRAASAKLTVQEKLKPMH